MRSIEWRHSAMPDWHAYVRSRLPRLACGTEREAAIVEEIAEQLHDIYEGAVRRGASPAEAEALARGEVSDWAALAHDLTAAEAPLSTASRRVLQPNDDAPTRTGMTSRNTFGHMWRDVTAAARALRRQPVLACWTILTLALGLGVLTGFFAGMHAMLLTPIAAHPDTVVRVWKIDPQSSISRYPFSYPEFTSWRDQLQAVTAIAAISYVDTSAMAVRLDDQSIPVAIAPVSTNFFSVLVDGPPLLGRWLTPADDGNRIEVAAVVSESFWRRVGASNHEFIGQRLHWPGGERALIVVGVASDSVTFPAAADVWVPIDGFFGTDPRSPNLDLHSRRFANFHFLARLRPGVSVETAAAEFNVVNRGITAAYPSDFRPMEIAAEPLLQATLGTLRPLTLFLFAAAALLFVVAGANVAALMMMRAAMQAREVAVRLALGARRVDILRQTLVESALLGVASIGMGLMIAFGCIRLVRYFAHAEFPRLEDVSLSGTILGFAAATVVLWVVTFGLAPLWQWRKVNAAHLASQLTSRTTRRGTALRAMVVGQVAIAVIVAASAALLLRSYGRLTALERGMDATSLAVVRLFLPEAAYPTPAAREALFDRLASSLRSLPGVIDATTVHMGPGTGQAGLSARMRFEGQPEAEARSNPYATWEPIMPSYFATMSARIAMGRAFTDADHAKTMPVAIVSESVARRYWPGQDPIGKQVQFAPQFPWTTVVGVAADVRYRELTREWLTVYFPAKQFFFFSPTNVVVRTAVSPASVAGQLRRAIAGVEPAAAVHSIETMDALMSREIARPRAAMAIGALFAGLAVVVAGIGVYAVFAFELFHRRRELAVHAAVGAQPRQILRAVLRQGLVLGAIGTSIGLAAAAWATPFLSAFLFEVPALDALSFLGAGGFALFIVTLASLAPARRAAQVNPSMLSAAN